MLHKLLGATLLAIAPLTVSASNLPEYPFIHVTGSAYSYVVPDIGALDFEIFASDADPAAARAAVEARIAEIRALYQEQGLSTDDVEIRDVRQNIRKGDEGAVAPVYQLKCTAHLTVRELTKWSAIAGGLLAKPNLDNFSVSFEASARDKIEMDLTAEAIKDARRRAEGMAAGFGRKVGPVTAVTSGALKNLTGAMGLVPVDYLSRRNSSDAAHVARSEIVNIVNLKFSQPVDVIFRIK
jgi:uncharacterized protein YggE